MTEKEKNLKQLRPTFLFFDLRIADEEGTSSLFAKEIEEVIPLWIRATKEGRLAGTFQTSQNSLLVLFQVEDAGQGITYLHFCRYNSSIVDADIVDKKTNSVTKIKRMAELNDSHAALDHCMCAYDSQTRLFAWQKSEKISLSAISGLLSMHLEDDLRLVPATYADSIEELPKINAEKLKFSMSLRNAKGAKEAIELEEEASTEAGIKIYRKLKDLIDEFDGIEIDVIIRSLQNTPEKSLGSQAIELVARALKKLNPMSDKHVDMIVEGHLKKEFSSEVADISETRIIDIYDNLLSIGMSCEVDSDQTIVERFPELEKLVFQACQQVRKVAAT